MTTEAYFLKPLCEFLPEMLETTAGKVVYCTKEQAKELEKYFQVIPDFPIEMVV